MRWLYLIVIVLFVLAVVIFAFQNFERITVTFLGLRASAPLAIVATGFYILGMVTGGSLLALLRRSIAGYRQAA
jgi:uncharacterized integral membrane protein